MQTDFSLLTQTVADLKVVRRFGRVDAVLPGSVSVVGLSHHARLGDAVAISDDAGRSVEGEIIALGPETATVMVYSGDMACGVGDQVELLARPLACPSSAWIGRIVDAFGQPIDGAPLPRGQVPVDLRRAAPGAGARRGLGPRINTQYAVMDTFLPLAKGQRIGIFAGSGVGKTSLLGGLAKAVEADVVVLGLIGERGRELREFTDKVLGPEGLARSVIVASTSDQSPLLKRRAAWMATAIAEVFRDQGKHVLLIIDSLTRFAEAHREIALTAGEAPSLRAFPPSTAHMIAGLTERAGTGADNMGDITAIYSVLVAGSDMEEPVADFARGVLDGHIVLDRGIAERGRFPAIDVGRSVSRALPDAASDAENTLLSEGRKVLNVYAGAETLVKTGLYTTGTDPETDHAIRIWPALDRLAGVTGMPSTRDSFTALRLALGHEEDMPAEAPPDPPVPDTV